jgi:hypothetical protein
MIGNDIVDLRQATKDSDWKRPRFLDKVFTKKEQSVIFSSENMHQTVWLLWSMKEAAYKAYVREFENVFFNPKRIQCQLGINNEGTAHIDDAIYYLKSRMTPEYVYSVASTGNDKCLETDIFTLFSENQSEAVRTELITQISLSLDCDLSSVQIIKTELGVPNLFLNEQQVFQALSMTHHGKYGAYAIC